ncbi:cytochrome P450 [Colletotrichum scovillei]|uniref:Cytochrome P450 n=1 Tax=Colletotrichum scovillei TaxID=1209932 RepID=A0A9P7R9U5_9PEZI|nr:cytochrome P450 [Colletotrichum scovillei]KAG7071761.1 cytochrome P450 [Colletotrichum scovillei]KAG7079977.1 cytochrome P450 [Colletotrichum scovillei]
MLLFQSTRERLSDTLPWPGQKRRKGKRVARGRPLEPVPAVRVKDIHVLAPDALVPCDEGREHVERGALGDKCAADGDVLDRFAGGEDARRVEAEDLAREVVDEGQALFEIEIVRRRVLLEETQDFGPGARLNVRVESEDVRAPGERRGGGLVACHHHVEAVFEDFVFGPGFVYGSGLEDHVRQEIGSVTSLFRAFTIATAAAGDLVDFCEALTNDSSYARADAAAAGVEDAVLFERERAGSRDVGVHDHEDATEQGRVEHAVVGLVEEGVG